MKWKEESRNPGPRLPAASCAEAARPCEAGALALVENGEDFVQCFFMIEIIISHVNEWLCPAFGVPWSLLFTLEQTL